jgi:hypothetical protein
MVLLPCGNCCGSCHSPFPNIKLVDGTSIVESVTGGALPDSIEVTITQGTSYSYSLSGSMSGSVYAVTATAPACSGTYSLSRTDPLSTDTTVEWNYLDANVNLVFRTPFVSASTMVYNGYTLRAFVRARVSSTKTVGSTVTAWDPDREAGGSVTKTCDDKRYVLNQDVYAYAGDTLIKGNGAFDHDMRTRSKAMSFAGPCCAPVSVTANAGVRFARNPFLQTWTLSSSTFPIAYTQSVEGFGPDRYFYEFDIPFTINSVNLIYPSSTVAFFDNIGQTSCPNWP